MRYYDNTRLSTHEICPRKFYFRHRRHLRPATLQAPLVFGSAWHSGMDVIWPGAKSDLSDTELAEAALFAFNKEWVNRGLPHVSDMTPEQLDEVGFRNAGVALDMFYSYVDQRRDFIRKLEVDYVELPFAVPLDPDDETLFYIGKMDKLVTWEGAKWCIEHKTTSEYKKDGGFRASFLEAFSPNSQIDGYDHGNHMLHSNQAKGVLVDGALVHKSVHDKFCFIPVERDILMLEAWLWEANEKVKRIEADDIALEKVRKDGGAANENILRAFPKRTTSCHIYNGCEYRGVCKMVTNPENVADDQFKGFIVDPWEPFDLLGLAKIGMDPE